MRVAWIAKKCKTLTLSASYLLVCWIILLKSLWLLPLYGILENRFVIWISLFEVGIVNAISTAVQEAETVIAC